ncbi:MAG: hypothetical protein V3S55_13980 [Nitrospiraceae bacterium]
MSTMTMTTAAVHGPQADTQRIDRLPVGTRFRLTLDACDHITFVFGTVHAHSYTCTTVVLEPRDPGNPRPWDCKPITWANNTLVTKIPRLRRE